MAKIAKIHSSKQPRRPHYIPQWTQKRHMKQADLSRELGADKGVVSRWFDGATPSEDWQIKLAAFFQIDREDLFRSPEDTWLSRLFKERKKLAEILQGMSPAELERAEQMLKLAFPPKTGTDG